MKTKKPNLGELKANRTAVARIDTIIFEIESELTRAAMDIPLVMDKRFYFESGKVAGLNESFKRLQDLRGLIVGESNGFKAKGKRK